MRNIEMNIKKIAGICLASVVAVSSLAVVSAAPCEQNLSNERAIASAPANDEQHTEYPDGGVWKWGWSGMYQYSTYENTNRSHSSACSKNGRIDDAGSTKVFSGIVGPEEKADAHQSKLNAQNYWFYYDR
jgi:hypothetical protein